LVITGAAGWLGRSLVDNFVHRLDSSGITQLVCLVHSRDDVDSLRSLVPDLWRDRVTISAIDIVDSAQVDRSFQDLESGFDVIHAAGIIHAPRIKDIFAVNATGTRHVLDASRRFHARRVVHVSSNSPFGTNPDPRNIFGEHEPFNPYLAYGRSKMEAELAVFEAVALGLDAVVVRPPWFYGPHQPARQTTFFSMVKAGRFPVFGSGDQSRSMVFVENLVDGIERARNWEGPAGRAWWIADAQPYSVREIVETVGQALKDEGFWVAKPSLRLPQFVGNMAEMADRVIQKTDRYVQSVHVLGEMNKSIACDISAARRDLGYEPQVSLYDGMRRSIRWCLGQGIIL
jgi:nucleoside-diphosphate-sugar epimerase